MEIHDRFLNLPTTAVTVLDVLTDNSARKSSIIRELVEACNEKIRNGSADYKILDVFRMILCYEYQSLVNSESNDGPSGSKGSSYVNVTKFFVTKPDGFSNPEEFALLYDIAVLQLVLHSNEQQIADSLRYFHDTRRESSTTRHENENLCLRVYECFVDSYNLRSRLYRGENRGKDSKEPLDRILAATESWMRQEEGIEWRSLASLLPKLVFTFGTRSVVPPLWSKVLAEHDDLGKALTALCVMADVCFPSEEKNVEETHLEQCVQKEFWSVVRRGLVSTIYQRRKQALYLAKRALDFIETHEYEVRKKLETPKENMVPFVLIDLLAKKRPMEVAKMNFFLILESLEEKQKHLVLPALTHLPSLLKAYSEQTSNGHGINAVWIRCVFERILRHDNNAIKTIGLREILRAHLDIYDEEFLYFLANTLNDTHLYEIDENNEKQPDIVTHLEEFFLRSEDAKMSLINKFVRTISRVSWCPVAIYWILRALLGVTKRRTIVHNTWTSEELKCVKNLVEKNLKKHCKTLRMNSQILILKAFIAYTRPNSDWSDVELVTETLTSLSESWYVSKVFDFKSVYPEHLLNIIKPLDAELFVSRTCERLMDIRSVKTFARTIILLITSKLICNRKDCSAKRALDRLWQNFIDADLRPYADTDLNLKIIELWYHVMNYDLLLNFHFTKPFLRILSYGRAILKIIDKGLKKCWFSSLNEYTLAMELLIRYAIFGDNNSLKLDLSNELRCFNENCANIFANPLEFSRNQWLYALKLSDLSKSTLFCKAHIPDVIRYFIDEILYDSKSDTTEPNVDSKRRFVSDCCETIAEIASRYIYATPSYLWSPNVDWFKDLAILVETGSERVVVPVAETLIHLLANRLSLVVQDLDNLKSLIRLAWRNVFQLNKTEVFDVVYGLMELLMDSNFLKLDGAKELAIECVDQLMKDEESVPNLKQIFINRMLYLTMEDMLHFQKPFISCLLHGAVPRHDQKIEQATISQGAIELDTFNYTNNKIRAASVSFLLRVIQKSRGLTCEFLTDVLGELILILEKNRNKRYFDNSHLHRLKHRATQALLVLEPHLNKEQRQILYDAVCDLLIAESNQPSVRLMQEWILVRIYGKHSDFRDSIWELFEMAVEKRPGSIVSVASVVFYVSRLLEGDAQIEYVTKAISYLLPNCMSQQFNVRLYSQAILVKMYEMLPNTCDEAEKYRGIYEGVRESLGRGNSRKNSLKVLDDFYFTIFEPFNDYSLETIYYQLPRLTGLSYDEWIKPEFIYQLDGMDRKNHWSPEIRNIWETMKPTVKQSQRPTGELVEETDSFTGDGLSDVQKKIIPWKSMVPFFDEPSGISKTTSLSRRNLRNEDASIIVVASLIDRPPNLGGLARTCEIFGAKELVIGSLRYAEDREFRTLSVSAEKWITITEVKSHLLKNYLLEKRSEGWKLVGAEQTANSTNLLQMEFDKKTILLLGNEKDGIPANLIPILDTCVEIPQNGVVRSLNVHVTGAICIWEYAKQHSQA